MFLPRKIKTPLFVLAVFIAAVLAIILVALEFSASTLAMSAALIAIFSLAALALHNLVFDEKNTAQRAVPAGHYGNGEVNDECRGTQELQARLSATEEKYRELLNQHRLQTQILDITNRILESGVTSSPLEDTFNAVIDICQTALGNDISTIALYDNNEDELVGVAKYGAPYNPEGYFRLPLAEPSLSGLAFKEGHTIAIDDVINDARVSQRVRRHFNARSGIAAPLVVEGQAIGVLLSMTAKRQRDFTTRDIALMEGLAREAALAVHTQMLQKNRIDAEHRFQRLVKLAPIAMLVLNKNGTILDANQAAADLLKTTSPDLLGHSFREFMDQDNAKRVIRALENAGIDKPTNIESTLQLGDGSSITAEIDASMYSIAGKSVVQVFIKDISQAKKLAKKMSYLATHDQLTGLANRSAFEESLVQALKLSVQDQACHALLYLDLDQFKLVNDSCGHVAGDELLKQLSALLRHRARDGDTLARLGGDEFGLLLHHCSLDKAQEIAEELREIIGDFRFRWEHKTFDIGVSIGVAPVTMESGTLEEVMKAVDAACYVAKELGRNRVHVYRPDDAALTKREGEMKWVRRIKQALSHGDFSLYAQTILPLAPDDGVSYCELLLRMRCDDGTTIQPAVFIPAAERYNLMGEIDNWVIEEVFRLLGQRQAQGNFEPKLCTINISGQSLCQDGFLQFLRNKLATSSVDPANICFEITETAALTNLANTVEFMSAMRELGCRFALDNFGSGLSSFNYLKHLPVDFLKIDGNLVRDITTDPVNRAMVEAINEIGHLMGLKTVAEFVEDADTLAELKRLGVDYAQGFFIGRPRSIC